MTNKPTRRQFGATALGAVLASAMPAPFVWAADKKYDPGSSDTEIKLGQTVPHSGPGSLYGVLGRVGEAYFQMLNENGGINGRQIKFLTMDDAYSAPKCVEATRHPPYKIFPHLVLLSKNSTIAPHIRSKVPS